MMIKYVIMFIKSPIAIRSAVCASPLKAITIRIANSNVFAFRVRFLIVTIILGKGNARRTFDVENLIFNNKFPQVVRRIC